MKNCELTVIKKNGTKEKFDTKEILFAIQKSASRVFIELTGDEKEKIIKDVASGIEKSGLKELPIEAVHEMVEDALEETSPAIAKSYKDYRDYRKEFMHMMHEVLREVY